MEQKQLKVELRTETGKGICRKLRAAGRVPGVVYGKGIEPVAVSLDARELSNALAGADSRNALLTLTGCDQVNGITTIISDMNRTALKGLVRHIDLHKINLDEKVHVSVAVKLVGSPKGVKDGGLLDFAMHQIDLECLAALIPGHIDVDVTDLVIGHSIHVSDLQLPTGVKALTDAKASIVSVLGKIREEEAAAE